MDRFFAFPSFSYSPDAPRPYWIGLPSSRRVALCCVVTRDEVTEASLVHALRPEDPLASYMLASGSIGTAARWTTLPPIPLPRLLRRLHRLEPMLGPWLAETFDPRAQSFDQEELYARFLAWLRLAAIPRICDARNAPAGS